MTKVWETFALTRRIRSRTSLSLFKSELCTVFTFFGAFAFLAFQNTDPDPGSETGSSDPVESTSQLQY
jgi:hypothetical protein